MIEIIFFDAGETLIHPHPSFAELFAQVCARRGRDVDPATVQEVQERLAPHLVDLADATGVENPSLSPEDSRTFWSFLYRRFLGELAIEDEELVGELYDTFSHWSSYKLFDDVLPALDHLSKSGYRLGLISNFEGWLEEMLIELEVGDVFDTTVISGIEGVEKPDERIYRIAVERAAVDPAAAVHVGDSPSMDVEPAAAVGMKAVLLDRVGRYAARAGDPGAVRIASLKELPQVLPKL